MEDDSAGGPLVGLAIAAVIGVVVWAAIRGQGKDWEVATEIDRGVMTDYCRLVGEGLYAEAWEKCLSASYRDEVPREKFAAAHEKRRRWARSAAAGSFAPTLTRNLFSKTRELHLLYELTYPGRTEREYAKASDADGSWRIEGTYHLNAGETYDFLLW
ncbi:MAG: hypothetical protein IPN03_23950 [Holophagales bacterium]|nr:hypothetical protein [Holophagales bacterium]